MPQQATPSASGAMPQQDMPSASGAMPQQNAKDAYRNASPPAEASRRNAALVPALPNALKVLPVAYLNRPISEPSAISAPNAPVANLHGSLRNKLIAGAVAVAVVAIAFSLLLPGMPTRLLV